MALETAQVALDESRNIANVDEYLVGLAIGTRFRANFGVEDRLGAMVDEILYSEDSYFNANVFPGVAADVGTRQLINQRNGDSLVLDNSNVVLDVNFGSAKSTFARANAAQIVDAYKRQILSGVLRDYKIKQIGRIGLVRKYLFPSKVLADTFVDRTVGGTLEGITDINLRFSKRYPADESLVRKGVQDYYNVIFSIIKKPDRQEIFMSVDYQLCFSPLLPGPEEIAFDDFVSRVMNYNRKSFVTWVQSNYLKA